MPLIKCPKCGEKADDKLMSCHNCRQSFWKNEDSLKEHRERHRGEPFYNLTKTVKQKRSLLETFIATAPLNIVLSILLLVIIASARPQVMIVFEGSSPDNNFFNFLAGTLLFISITIGSLSALALIALALRSLTKKILFWLSKTISKVGGTNKKVLIPASIGVLFVLAGIFLYFLNAGYLSSYIDVFPAYKTGQKTTYLTCDYAGKTMSITIDTYSNVDRYYHNKYSQKTKLLGSRDFTGFVYSNSKDNTITSLADKIRSLARSYSLNDDQTVELASCLVQNIPYDQDDFYVVKTQGNTNRTESFPYETLFNNKGICTDKTYLGSAILKELGYGTGIFLVPGHMALGISVPNTYASYNTGYAYWELTNIGYPPGEVPSDIIQETGLPTPRINTFDQLNSDSDPNSIVLHTTSQLASPVAYSVNSGKVYSRIVSLKNLENIAVTLINTLADKKTNLTKAYSNISYWNGMQAQAYNTYLSTPSTTQSCSYWPYLGMRCYQSPNYLKNLKYSTYSTYFNNYKKAVSNYNSLVNDYNNTLSKINSTINQYKTYQYN